MILRGGGEQFPSTSLPALAGMEFIMSNKPLGVKLLKRDRRQHSDKGECTPVPIILQEEGK